MGLTFNLGRVSPSVFTDSSLNVGIGAAPSGSYKLEVTGTAKVSSTLLLGGALTGTSATFTNFIANTGSTNTTAYLLNRGSSSFDGVLEWQDGGSSRWKVGTFGTGSGDLRFYSAATGGYPLTLSYGSGAATFSGSVAGLTGNFTNTTSGNIFTIGTTYAGGRNIQIGVSDGTILPTAAAYINDNTGVGVYIGDNSAATKGLYVKNGGNVLIGTVSDNSARLQIVGGTNTLHCKGNTSTSFGATITAVNSADTQLLLIRNDGLFYTGTAALSPYNYGVSGGVVLYVGSSGQLGYNSSIRESKSNITNIENVDWLKELQPVTFNKKKKDDEGNYTEELESQLEYGLIAEDVEIINPNFVFYDKDNKLAGVHYDRLIAPILKLVQEQQAQIQELSNRLNKAGL